MKIHTKTLDGDTQYPGYAMLEYAKEVLGDAWTYTGNSSSGTATLSFKDSNENLHGWRVPKGGGNTTLVSNGVSTSNTGALALPSLPQFVGVVLETNSGSVGVGFQNDSGQYVILFLLTKFDGIYNSKDLYSVSTASRALSSSDYVSGKMMIHGTVDIGECNHFSNAAGAYIGSGIYLHPLYDPISGLASSDIFGVKSAPSISCFDPGMVVKQGSTSYMAILSWFGGGDIGPNPRNVLFIKM